MKLCAALMRRRMAKVLGAFQSPQRGQALCPPLHPHLQTLRRPPCTAGAGVQSSSTSPDDSLGYTDPSL